MRELDLICVASVNESYQVFATPFRRNGKARAARSSVIFIKVAHFSKQANHFAGS